jgi:hypothetical protein
MSDAASSSTTWSSPQQPSISSASPLAPEIWQLLAQSGILRRYCRVANQLTTIIMRRAQDKIVHHSSQIERDRVCHHFTSFHLLTSRSPSQIVCCFSNEGIDRFVMNRYRVKLVNHCMCYTNGS